MLIYLYRSFIGRGAASVPLLRAHHDGVISGQTSAALEAVAQSHVLMGAISDTAKTQPHTALALVIYSGRLAIDL